MKPKDTDKDTPRRKRGRPAKQQKQAEAAPQPTSVADNNAEPSLSQAVSETEANTAPAPVQPESLQPDNAKTKAAEEPTAQETSGSVTNENPEENVPAEDTDAKNQQQSKDSTFGLFFRSERKFVPRSQREKEAAAAAKGQRPNYHKRTRARSPTAATAARPGQEKQEEPQ